MTNSSFVRLLSNDIVEGWSRNFDYKQYCELADKWGSSSPVSQEDYELACNILENESYARGLSESVKFLERAKDQFLPKEGLESRVQELEKTVCLLRNAISMLQARDIARQHITFPVLNPIPIEHWKITCRGTP